MKFVSGAIKISVLAIAIIGLLYFGACVYGNAQAFVSNPTHIPDVEDAQYSAKVVNTNLVLFSNDAVRSGSVVTLNGFWDYDGDRFRWHDEVLPLDESIWGPVELRLRQ